MKIITPARDEDEAQKPHFPFDTKPHADIADMLDSYRIPFFYKQPTLVIENGKRCIEYIDFFLPTYNGLAIDYIVESQSGIYRRKKNVYQDNQIPAVLMSRRDLDNRNWQKRLYVTIQNMYHKRSHSYVGKARQYK